MNINTDHNVKNNTNDSLVYHIIGYQFTTDILNNLKVELVAVSNTAQIVDKFHPKKLLMEVNASTSTLTNDILKLTSTVCDNGISLKFLDDTIICVSDFIALLKDTLSALQNGTYVKKLDVFQLLPTAAEVLAFFYGKVLSPTSLYAADDLLASIIALANEYRDHKNFLPKHEPNSHYSIYGSVVAV